METPKAFFVILVSVAFQFICWNAKSETINGLENSPLTEAWAVVGGQVLLPCDMDPPIKNDSTHLVLFYYADSGTPIYSLDSRNSDLKSATHWADGSMVSRAFVRTTPGQRGLILEGITVQDQGEYRCRVDFLESPTRNSRIKLTVVFPPERVEISSNLDGRRKLKGRVGPYTLGEEVVFTCKATGGTPRPSVSWWDGDLLLDNDSESTSGQKTRNDLIYLPMTRYDFNRTLTCLVSNSDLVKPLTASVTIDLNYPPKAVLLEGGVPQVTLKEGVAKRITCEVIGSRPPAKIIWSLGERNLSVGAESVKEEVLKDGRTRSVLSYTPSLEDDEGILECTAFNPIMAHVVLTNSTGLSVLYKPRMALQPEEGIYLEDLRQNDDVTLRCLVDANPLVTGVHWAHNEVPLQEASGLLHEVEVYHDTLILHGISRSSSGNYTCAAANTEGATTSAPLLIEVKFPPICSRGQQTVFGAARHEQLFVPCSVEAHPPPSAFRWAMNTSTGLVDIALGLSNSSGSRSTVRYTPQTHLDFGDLLCWASNGVERQETPCVFHVIPAAKPESVSECTAERNSTMPASFVVVSCTGGWGGGLNQSFTLEVRRRATEEVLEKFSLATKPNFVVTGLKIGVPYLLTVTPANSRGSGPPVTLSYTAPTASADKVILPHSDTSAVLSFTPLVVVLVGVLLGVSVCVGVGVLLGRRKMEWRKKDQVKMTYCTSLKDLHEAQDLPTIIRIDSDREENMFKHCSAMNSSQSSLYVNPARLLNNVSSRYPF